jgi:hypothetical protein
VEPEVLERDVHGDPAVLTYRISDSERQAQREARAEQDRRAAEVAASLLAGQSSKRGR